MDTTTDNARAPRADLPTSFAAARAIVEAALEEHVEGYAGWDAATRARWRASPKSSVGRAKDEALDSVLVAYTGITPEAMKTTKGFLSSRDLVEEIGVEGREFRNLCALAMDGIGDDWCVLNEYMPEGRTLLDYHTVGAWDRDQHAAQLQGMREDQIDPAFVAQRAVYHGNLYAEWARMVYGDRLAYLCLHSLAHYVASVLEERADALIQTLVPHGYAKNPDHGKDTGNGAKIWSMRTDAGGKEAILDALQKAQRAYIAERTLLLQQRCSQEARGRVWMIPTPPEDVFVPGEQHWNVVFSDPSAMDGVRWASFLADVAAVSGDAQSVSDLVQEETQLLDTALMEAHAAANAAHPKEAALPPYTPPKRQDMDDGFL